MGSAAESRSGPGGDHARDAGPAAGARGGSGAVKADASPARGTRAPEAFRDQDLAHQDVIALARRLAGALPDREAPVLIVGVRTAGAYFAPLVRALLAAEGWARVSWIAVRPELGLSRWEARQLRRLRHGDARVALVRDH